MSTPTSTSFFTSCSLFVARKCFVLLPNCTNNVRLFLDILGLVSVAIRLSNVSRSVMESATKGHPEEDGPASTSDTRSLIPPSLGSSTPSTPTRSTPSTRSSGRRSGPRRSSRSTRYRVFQRVRRLQGGPAKKTRTMIRSIPPFYDLYYGALT